MVLEDRALEILHGEAGPRIGELLAEGQAENAQGPVVPPVVAKAEAEAVASGRVEGAALAGGRGNRLERRLTLPIGAEQGAQASKLHRPARWSIRMVLEHGPFEVLHRQPVLGKLFGDGVAKARDPALVTPVIEKAVAEIMAGGREIDQVGAIAGRGLDAAGRQYGADRQQHGKGQDDGPDPGAGH